MILFLIGWLSGTNNYIINRFTRHNNIVDTVYVERMPFSEDAFIEALKDVNVRFPYIALAQAKIETGNFTSQVFKENHNLFGMKLPRIRTTTALGTKNNHAYYNNWLESVYDYAMYQNYMMCNIETESEYYCKLGESYAEDSTYATTIRATVDKMKLKRYFDQ